MMGGSNAPQLASLPLAACATVALQVTCGAIDEIFDEFLRLSHKNLLWLLVDNHYDSNGINATTL